MNPQVHTFRGTPWRRTRRPTPLTLPNGATQCINWLRLLGEIPQRWHYSLAASFMIIIWLVAMNTAMAQTFGDKNNLSTFSNPANHYTVQVNGCNVLAGCLAIVSVTGAANVADNDLTNFATASITGVSVLGNITKSARADLQSGTVSKGGDFAGWVISSGGLLDVNLLNSLTINTYKNNVLVESKSGSSLIGLDLVSILGTPVSEVGFKTGAGKDFDEVEIVVGGGTLGVSLFSNVNFYYAFGAPPVAFSFVGGGNGAACSTSNLTGTFSAGGTSTGSVDVSVNVTTIGASTIFINGSGFTGSKSFTSVATGVQTVTVPLTYDGTGTTGTRSLTVASSASTNGNCVFPVTVSAAPAPGCVAVAPSVWLRANTGTNTTTDGSTVTAWADQSVNNRNAGLASLTCTVCTGTATGGIYRAGSNSKAINFNPVVEFTGAAGSYLNGPTGGMSTQEQFVVFQSATATTGFQRVVGHLGANGTTTSNANQQGIYINYSDGNTGGTFSTGAVNQLIASNSGPQSSKNSVHVYRYNHLSTTAATSTIDGTTSSVAPTTLGTPPAPFTDKPYRLGADIAAGTPYSGVIAEVISFPSFLSTTQRQQVQSYLAIKYGVTLSHAYLSGTATNIWNTTALTGYASNIAGIGREDCQQLYQKQSLSVGSGAFVTIGIGQVATTNAANSFSLTDGTYLMWGSDNGALTATSLATATTAACPAQPGIEARLTRQWRAQETGSVGPTAVQVPVASLSSSLQAPYYLLVADDAALTTNVQYIPMVTAGSNLSATYDFNGVKFFTFAGVPTTTTFVTGNQYLRWNTPANSWTSGSLTKNVTLGSGLTVNTTVTDASSILAPGYPKMLYGYPALYINTNSNTKKVVFSSQLNQVATGVQFSVYDLDRAGSLYEEIRVTGFRGATPVQPVLSKSPLSTVSISGSVASGQINNIPTNSVYGKVNITFNQPIDKFTIEYRNLVNTALRRPAAMLVSDISFSGPEPVLPSVIPDLVSLQKIAPTGNQAIGDTITYTFRYNNANCGNKTVNFTDVLPAGFTWINGSLISASSLGTTNGYGGTNTLGLTNVSLLPGITTFTADAVVGGTPGIASNQASYSVAGGGSYLSDDPNVGGTTDPTNVTVTAALPNLPVTISKSANPATVTGTGSVTFAYVLTNSSGSNVSVDLADDLQPDLVTYATGSLNLGGLTSTSSTLGLDNNSLLVTGLSVPPGSRTVTVVANMNSLTVGSYENYASLTPTTVGTYRPYPVNSNSASFTVVTLLPPTIAINSPANGTTVAGLNPVISGTATAGSTVTLTASTGSSVTALASATGSYTATFPVSFTAGLNSVTAVAGNAGGTSSPVVTTFTAVPQPTVAITSPINVLTSATPTISGTATPGAVVTLTGGAGVLGGPVSVTANASGLFSTSALTFPTGLNSVTAVAVNAGGLSSPATATFTVAAPTTLTVNPIGPLTNTTPTITGTATPNSLVVITSPTGVTLCSTIAVGGLFSCSITLPVGPNMLTVSTVGLGGIAVVPVSLTAIGLPTVAITTPLLNGTATTTPTITGLATPNAVVTLTGGLGGPVSVTANAAGVFSTSALTFAPGTNSLTAVAVNLGGISLPSLTSFSVIGVPSLTVAQPLTAGPLTQVVSGTASVASAIVITGPTGLTLCATVANASGLFSCSVNVGAGVNSLTVTAIGPGGITTGAVNLTGVALPTVAITPLLSGTATTTPLISGTATPNAVVTLTGGLGGPVSVTANAAGVFSTSALTFAPGTNSLTAVAVNLGGISLPALTSFSVIGVPSLTVAQPLTAGPLTQVVSGTASVASAVVITGANGLTLCATVADATGLFSCSVNVGAGVNSLTVTAIGPGGITTGAVNLTGVALPTVLITPLLNGTATTTPTISGLATPNAVVTLTGGLGGPVSVTANAAGVFSTSALTFAPGTNSLTAVAVNLGGISLPSLTSFSVIGVPSLTVAQPLTAGPLTQVVSGTASVASAIVITGPTGLTLCATVANASGLFSCSVNVGAGVNSLTVTAIGPGGITTGAVNLTGVALPTVAITPLLSGTATTTPLISGTATPNAVVTLTGGLGGPVSVTANAAGVFSTSALTFAPGTNSLTAVAVNLGGISLPSLTSFSVIGVPSLTVAQPLTAGPLTQVVSGTASVASAIVITGPTGLTLCATVANASGLFSCSVNVGAGVNSLTVTAIGPGGITTGAVNLTGVALPTVLITPLLNGTATTSPTISGTATPNAVVTLTGGLGGPVSVTANAAGVFSTSALTFAPGTNSLTAVAVNLGGISLPSLTSFSVIGVPSLTVAQPLTAGPLTQVVSGTASVASAVVITGANGLTLCATVADATGLFSCSVNVGAGVNSLTVTAIGPGGITTGAVNLTGVALPTVLITPLLNGTATTSPTISGTATPNAVVTLTGGLGGPVSVTANAAGVFSTSALTFAPGTNSLTAVAVNLGGISLPSLTSFSVIGVPSLTVAQPLTAGPLTQVVSGTASVASAIVITGPTGLTLCATVANASGLFSCSVNVGAGVNSLTVTAIGPGGITTGAVNLTGVALPTVAITPLLSGTATTTPLISGTATPNAVVTLTGGLGGPVSVTANAAGVFSTSALTFAPGTNSLTAVAVNLGGISLPSLTSFSVIGVPSLTVAQPLTAGPLTQVVSGTASVASAIVITGPTGLTLCATVANAAGLFSCSVNVGAGVNSLTVTAIGPGGITTGAVNLTGVALPTVAITPLLSGTATTTPLISGTATPNAVVTLTGGLGGPVSVTANAAGVFSTSALTFAPGTNSLTAVAVNLGGISLPSLTSFSVIGVPSLTVAQPLTAGPLTQVVSGTASVASAIVITGPTGLTLCATVANAAGLFSCSVNVGAGVNSLTVTAMARVASPPGAVNLTGVALPTVLITPLLNGTATTTPTISGTATPNAVVTLTGGLGGPVSVTANAAGVFSTSALTFAPGTNSLTAVAVNLGGISLPSLTSFSVIGVPSLSVAAALTVGPLTQVVSGTTVGATAVVITDANGLTLCTTVAVLSSTTFSCPLNLTAGQTTVTVTAIGPGGITTTMVTLSAVVPPSLTVVVPPVSGTATVISGTATPGSGIVITNPIGATLCSTVATSGTFACSITVPVGPVSLTVTATGPGGSTAVPVNLTAVAVPTVAILSPANGSTVATTTTSVSGTATANSTVVLTGPVGTTLGTVVATASGTFSVTGLTFPAGAYSLTATATNQAGTGISAVSSFTVASPVVNTTVSLPIRVYLQGALTSTTVTATMRDDLRSKGLVPLVEPYTLLGYVHVGGGGGETTTSAVLSVTGANAIVDWVVAELRSAANPAQIIATRSGLLQRDGDLVDVDGVTSLTFGMGAPAGTSYFVSVHHRNHLGVMTATALPLSTTNTVVDFISTSTAVYQFPVGNALRSSAPLALEGGLRALWAGNTTGDTRVILQGPDNDADPVFFSIVGDPNNTQTFTNFVQSPVYSTNDVNLDGKVIFQGPDNEVDLIFFEILSHPDNTSQFVNFIIRQQIP